MPFRGTDALVVFDIKFFNKMIDQKRDILRPLA